MAFGNLSKSLFVRRAAVHKRLCYDRQTRVDDVRLVNVKQKLGILDDVHPETQQQTTKKQNYVSAQTRSSTTTEKQRVSCTRLARLAN